MASASAVLAMLLLFLPWMVNAIDVDVNSTESVKKAASIVAHDMVRYYKGNESGQIPGLLPKPYYWWEAGAMFGALISYRFYTGDSTYDAITMQAMQFQIGPFGDYMPPEQTSSMGNDDQAFWGMAALAAAETNFPNPPNPKDPSWLALAQAVFNEQVGRWDTRSCNGGIHWQVPEINAGYNLKNTISNGCLFNIAARLARYTGDDHYAEWAVKIWDWLARIGLIDESFHVFDNAEAMKLNCTELDRNRWTYNAGTLLMGASTMFNYTNGDALWRNRTAGLLSTITTDFFPTDIMREGCEDIGTCNVDQRSFKAYLSRWMAVTTQMAPFTFTKIHSLLQSSAKAAAAQCTGGASGTTCGIKWRTDGKWDGTDGVGQSMSALEVLLGTLVKETRPPVTSNTGGNSASNPTAGHNSSDAQTQTYIPPATRGSKIGAWFLTAVIVVMAVWTTWFLISNSWEEKTTAVPSKEKMKEKEPMVLDLKGKRSSQLVGGDSSSRKSVAVLPPISNEETTMPKDVEKGEAIQGKVQ
ncbi:uncharacterized protein BP5553_07374 [Venustampulla echinocandica]|uniref:mannan endo-1,6-alpha-mannosidase n=1 Tax=Venustampulla echinocandica TaxID=2656787 RepID=A0A370TJA0_9HELO|nr:uncharacterized protein BP5553_07374 [Venustampulla echinocandica]RDL35443.1 hypothetical protein BP5553_07374 [Venustampulla echinocandica]